MAGGFIMKINIIDPSSTEFNRGSFCYAPYLAYIGLSEMGYDVSIYESFKAEDLDSISDADIQLVCLWSYPQIETAMLLSQMLHFEKGKDNTYYIGYSPLIDYLGLQHHRSFFGCDLLSSGDFIKKAMFHYPDCYKKFNRLLLSDCDMHLRSIDTGSIVHPLFTSYGCPNGCTFCPSTINCDHKRIALSVDDTLQMFDKCKQLQIYHIHLTDEDFFFNIRRAYTILNYLQGEGFHIITLGSASQVKKFLDTYGSQVIEEAGIELIEIGFESGNDDISQDMGAGKSLSACYELASKQQQLPFRIFWLVLTFFPGETIKSLNHTGDFMREYGFEMKDVLGRLRTNGTKGGLGQFFQPYHGTPIYNDLRKDGLFITERPIRLMPSYIPNSFLYDPVNRVNHDAFQKAIPWLDLYNAPHLRDIQVGQSLNDYIDTNNPKQTMLHTFTFAILARMGVIE